MPVGGSLVILMEDSSTPCREETGVLTLLIEPRGTGLFSWCKNVWASWPRRKFSSQKPSVWFTETYVI